MRGSIEYKVLHLSDGKNDETQLTNGIGFEAMNELMIKEVGKTDWSKGNLDFLGYLY